MSKLTKEIVNERIADRGIELIGEYVNGKTKSTFRCEHGHEWDTQPGPVMAGNGCPHCSGCAPLTKEIVNERIADRSIEMIGEYVTARTKSTFCCEHGYEWNAVPSSVMGGRGCPHCASRVPLTKEVVNERLAGRGIEMIGEYVTMAHKSTFRCEHGHEWVATPSSVISAGTGCPHCSTRPPLTKEIVNERIADRGIEMIGEFVRVHTKATFRCEHGHDWDALPNSVMAGKGCPHCASRSPLTKEVVNERIANRGIEMIGECMGTHTKSTFRCEHGHEWVATPSSVMFSTGCPSCATSGFNPKAPAILYYLRVQPYNADTVYKVGITNNTVERRFTSNELAMITVINIVRYDHGGDARDAEQSIMAEFKSDKYVGDAILDSGNTELFTRDVLGLDELGDV